jgi:3-phenylpropionate/trans-cinnamate dioxygenase ferredoxin reductase subunit
MDMSRTIIVGGGQAGGRCAITLRSKGYEGDIVLIGEEPRPPYRRPPLSKTVLLGENTVEDGYFRSPADYAENGVDLQLERRVAEVDADKQQVRCEDGETAAFDHLVFATGASPRVLPLPGHELEGVFLLRTARHALSIKEQLQPGRRIVIIGGGFIGLEVASSARQLGCEVTVLEAMERLLSRSVPPRAAEAVTRVHDNQGVDIRTGVGVEAFAGEGRVRRVALSDGAHVEADAVIVGIGIAPNTSLAETAGIEVSNGILTDEFGRTSVNNVYAAGDCASCFLPRYGRNIRLESFQNADQQGMNVAATIAGQPAGYNPVPFVWSDQHSRVLQTVGFPAEGERHVQRGSVEEQNMVLFSIKDGKLVGVTGWGKGMLIAKDVRFSQKLIEMDVEVDADRLADPDVPVKDLMPKP